MYYRSTSWALKGVEHVRQLGDHSCSLRNCVQVHWSAAHDAAEVRIANSARAHQDENGLSKRSVTVFRSRYSDTESYSLNGLSIHTKLSTADCGMFDERFQHGDTKTISIDLVRSSERSFSATQCSRLPQRSTGHWQLHGVYDEIHKIGELQRGVHGANARCRSDAACCNVGSWTRMRLV